MSEAIRILLVEDHAMVLAGLQAALEPEIDLAIVTTATTLGDARVAMENTTVDVVVTDFHLPDGNGAEVTDAVARSQPGVPVLVISGLEPLPAVEAAISSGCAGFVSKGRGIDELAAAIRAVVSGAAVFPAGLLAEAVHRDATRTGATLTEREREVLQKLAEAKTAEEIATELYVSVFTARNHIRSILTKLQARSQLAAVVIAARAGLVQLS